MDYSFIMAYVGMSHQYITSRILSLSQCSVHALSCGADVGACPCPQAPQIQCEQLRDDWSFHTSTLVLMTISVPLYTVSITYLCWHQWQSYQDYWFSRLQWKHTFKVSQNQWPQKRAGSIKDFNHKYTWWWSDEFKKNSYYIQSPCFDSIIY